MGGYSQLPVTPFHQSDPLQQAGQLMQLKNALAQQQLIPGQIQQQQQQITATGQENQMRALQLQDQQKLRDLSPKYVKKDDSGNVTGYDFDGFVKGAQAAGISPQTINQLQLQRAETTEKLAGADAATRNNEAAKNKAAYDVLEGVRGIQDPNQRQSAYMQGAQTLAKMGVDTSKFPAQVPDDGTLSSFEAGLGVHAQIIADAKTKAETFKDQQQGESAQAQANKLTLETNPNAPADPNIARQKYEGILQQIGTKGFGSIAPADMQWARAYENAQKKTTTQADSLGVTSTNTSGPSGLAAAGVKAAPAAPVATPQGVTPPAGAPQRPAIGSSAPINPQSTKNSIIDEIGQYKLNPAMLSRLVVKHPELIAQVNQKYPDWSQPNYNSANKAITDLAPSGKTGQQITSYNTFLRHAGALYDAVDKLNNSTSSDLLNKPLNWLAQHTGDPRVADFMAAMQPPMKEFQSFLLNNHAMHEEDVKDAHALIDQNKTPQEIKAVLNRFAETGSARLSEQNESFKRVTGRDIPNLVSPEAAKAYNKITGQGGNGGGASVPSGATGKAKGSDGQWHYHDAKGNDLGVAQ